MNDNFKLVERIYQDQSAINDLNTYRNWNMFGLQAESIYDDGMTRTIAKGGTLKASSSVGDWGGYGSKKAFMDDTFWNRKTNSNYNGVKSLFNNVHAVNLGSGNDGIQGYRIPSNTPLLDSQRVRDAIRQRGGCSIKELCEASANGFMGRAIYNYSDFMYCKHLGKISNNYLITLRRFPYPAGDHINFTDPLDSNEKESNHHMPDSGRLVTWLGTPGNDIQEILKYEVLMPYKEMLSQIQNVEGTAESGGVLGAICNMTNSNYSARVLAGHAGAGSLGYMSKMLGNTGKYIAGPPDTSWMYHRDASKAYGPVDVIAKTHIRAGGEDGGLKFEQNINLVFDYELRSYDGINTRAAVIDLISNILAVCFTDGKFWGGGYHANGPSQSSLFTNLPIFKLGANGQKATFNEIKDAVSSSIGQVARSANGGQPITGMKDILNIAMNLLSNAANMLVGGALNALGRPQKQGMDSLLRNEPVGLWHLTIGNPRHPIMSMGNMILDKVEIQHYGSLGLDDMPTGLRVNIGLKHGMPRDRRQIEFMYNSGDFRSYIPMGKHLEYMYLNAEDLGKATKPNPDNETISDDYPEPSLDAVAEYKSHTPTMQYMFGTEDMSYAIRSSMEAHQGSSLAINQKDANDKAEQAKKEAEAEEEEVKKANNKNSR